ncbi:MAG: hypothetical protein AAGD01_17290 [Acidobacteriota bacterium]
MSDPSEPHSSARSSSSMEESSAPQPFSLLAAAAALRRALPVVALSAVAGAALAAAWVLLMTPVLFQTSATLLVPPSLPGEDNIGLLTVQGYLELAQSPEIVEQARQRASTALGQELKPSGLGRFLDARRVGAERTSEASRLLVLEARWGSAVGAAALASGWANSLLERCESLAAEAGGERVDRWEKKLEEAQGTLSVAAVERRELIDGIELKYQRLAEQWRQNLARQQARTQEQLAELERRQQLQLAKAEQEWSLSGRRLKAEVARGRYVAMLQQEMADEAWEEGGGERLGPGEAEELPPLAEISGDLVVADPGTDPAEDGLSVSLEPAGLVPETEPTESSAEPEIEVVLEGEGRFDARADGGGPRSGESPLEYAARVVRRTEYRLQVAQSAVDDMRRQFALDRQRLENQRELERQRLQSQRDQALGERDPEIAQRLEELERTIVDQEGILDSVTRRIGTRSGGDAQCRLQLAAAAVPPAQAQGRRAGAKSIIGLVIGAALGLLLAAAREGERGLA